ncbi:MAG: VOC family protein [Candidatus Eisenbacteria bacterium]
MHIVVRGAARAIDFYRRAFGAEEILRLTGADGEIAHAELRFGDALLYLNDESRDHDEHSPESLGGAAASLHLYVDDVDAAYARAVAAGAVPRLRVADMFWGERYGTVRDPFGYEWALATRTEVLSPAEIRARAQRLIEAPTDEVSPPASPPA